MNDKDIATLRNARLAWSPRKSGCVKRRDYHYDAFSRLEKYGLVKISHDNKGNRIVTLVEM